MSAAATIVTVTELPAGVCCTAFSRRLASREAQAPSSSGAVTESGACTVTATSRISASLSICAATSRATSARSQCTLPLAGSRSKRASCSIRCTRSSMRAQSAMQVSRPLAYSCVLRGRDASSCSDDLMIVTAVFSSCAASLTKTCCCTNASSSRRVADSSAPASTASSAVECALFGAWNRGWLGVISAAASLSSSSGANPLRSSNANPPAVSSSSRELATAINRAARQIASSTGASGAA